MKKSTCWWSGTKDKEAAVELVKTAAEQSQGFSQWLSDAYASRCCEGRKKRR